MIHEIFSVAALPDLELSVPAGAVTVDEGPAGTVEVTVATNRPELWEVAQHGNTVSVGLIRSGIPRGGNARVNVLAPAGSSLKCNTASADVRIRLDLDVATLATASADILAGDCRSASVKTASGDVVLGHVSGDASIRSASGDVRVAQVDGSTSVTTASGDVTVDVASGPLSATSASGDLRVNRYLGPDIEAATMSGDVDLGLPAGIGVQLKANTLSGRVQLPEKRKSARTSDRTVAVRLKSVSGDLRIRRLD